MMFSQQQLEASATLSFGTQRTATVLESLVAVVEDVHVEV